MSNDNLVSCLCVTEDREAFIPWLLWNYDKQDWPNKELIIVDSSAEPLSLSGRSDINIVYTKHRSTLGYKRNIALEYARGKKIAWFDDDDWQHPTRLTQLINNSTDNDVYIGPRCSYFVDFLDNNCKKIKQETKPFFNGTLFSSDYIKSIGFKSWLHGVEAAVLMNDINTDVGKMVDQVLFFWLSHPTNVENPRGKWLMDTPIEALADEIGVFWGDTSEQLKILKDRIYNL